MVNILTLYRRLRAAGVDERGFTLVELLVASAVSVILLGGAVMLTTQIQNGYRRQVEDSTAIQEGRYALDWIGRLIRSAGNNPYFDPLNPLSDCPVWGGEIEPIALDPNENGINDDIRIRADRNPADGACSDADEDVTISFDPANNVIVFVDNNLGGEATVRTDQVIDDLLFIYRNPGRVETADAADIVYVEVQLTVRTRTRDPFTNAPVTRTLSQEFRVRGR